MKYFTLFACFFVLLFSGCNELDPKGENEVRTFVKKWNNNHTQLKAPYLKQDYLDVVTYYGNERTATEVEQHKLVLFEEFPDYTQRIKDDELSITKEGRLYLVVFMKQVQYDGLEAEYKSFLSVILKNGDYKIVSEGVAADAKNQDTAIFPEYREKSVLKSRNRQLFGDFNGDGLSDYVYVDAPELLNTSKMNAQNQDTACKGKCTSVINFSVPELNAITVENAYNSQLENLKDLNGDGADELGFWNIKPNSKSLYIFNAITGKLLTPPVVINTAVHKNLSLIDVFKKSGPNKITVTRSMERDGKWELVSEVVVLQ